MPFDRVVLNWDPQTSPVGMLFDAENALKYYIPLIDNDDKNRKRLWIVWITCG